MLHRVRAPARLAQGTDLALFRWRKRVGSGYLRAAGGGRNNQREMHMIRVVAIITANPGRREELLAAFRANVPNVHAEKGCIEYAGHIDAATVGPFQTEYGPDSLVVLESWESPEALRAHVAAPHMKAYSEKTKDLVAKRTIHILSAID
jgi:quinol monooxygenase YgiN